MADEKKGLDGAAITAKFNDAAAPPSPVGDGSQQVKETGSRADLHPNGADWDSIMRGAHEAKMDLDDSKARKSNQTYEELRAKYDGPEQTGPDLTGPDPNGPGIENPSGPKL